MPSEGSRSKQATIGEQGMLRCQLHLLDHGYNVALPVVPDGTDMVIYDRGQCWQAQVKSISTDYVDLREPPNRSGGRSRKLERYQYVDVFIFCHVTSGNIWCIPSAILKGRGQVKITSYPPISADVIRHTPITCEDGHSCAKPCDECVDRRAAMTASDRRGIEAFVSRSLRPRRASKHDAN